MLAQFQVIDAQSCAAGQQYGPYTAYTENLDRYCAYYTAYFISPQIDQASYVAACAQACDDIRAGNVVQIANCYGYHVADWYGNGYSECSIAYYDDPPQLFTNSYYAAYVATSVTGCHDCPVGTYSGGGTGSCTACATGKTTVGRGATSSSECTCGAGYYGSSCSPCALGSYKDGGGTQACTVCWQAPSTWPSWALQEQNHGVSYSQKLTPMITASTGSTAYTDCLCPAGTGFGYDYDVGNHVNEVCVACDPGGFQPDDVHGYDAYCRYDCGTSSDDYNSWSWYGASECECNFGYYLATHGQCQGCDPGTYKDTIGDDVSACVNCPTGSTSTNYGTQELSQCICDIGYESINDVCQPCPAGQYGWSASVCTNCPAGKYQTGTGKTSVSDCLSCPADSSSPAGSDALADCLCGAGYTGPNGGTCTQCAAGKFKTTTGSAACTDCQAGYESNPAHFTNCLICPQGEYEDASEYCVSCPANTYTSASGSYALTDCQCNAGYAGPNGGTCTQCAVGKYKQTLGSVCSDCNAGQTSVSPFTNCLTCAAGKYELNFVCLDCDVYYSSPSGSSGASSCTFQDCPANLYETSNVDFTSIPTPYTANPQIATAGYSDVAISPDCNYAVFTYYNGNYAALLDLSTNTVIQQFTRTQTYACQWISNDLFIYMSRDRSRFIWMDKINGVWTEKSFSTYNGQVVGSTYAMDEAGLWAAPDGSYFLYTTADSGRDTSCIKKYTFATDTWTLGVGHCSSQGSYDHTTPNLVKFRNPSDITVNADQTQAYIADKTNGRLRLWDMVTGEVTGAGAGPQSGNLLCQICSSGEFGSYPSTVQYTPDYKHLIVGQQYNNALSSLWSVDMTTYVKTQLDNNWNYVTALSICQQLSNPFMLVNRWSEIRKVEFGAGGATCESCPEEAPLSVAGSSSVDACYNCAAGKVYDNALSSCVNCEAGKYTQEALEFDVSGWCTTNSYTDKNLNGHYVQDGHCYDQPRYSMTDEYGNKWYMHLNVQPDSSLNDLFLMISLSADCVSSTSSSDSYAFIRVQNIDIVTYGLDLFKFNADYSHYFTMGAAYGSPGSDARVWAMYCSTGWEWSQYATPMQLSNFVRTGMNDAPSCVSCGVGKYSSNTGATSSLTCQSCNFPSFQNNAGASSCSTTTCTTNDYFKHTTNILQVAVTWAPDLFRGLIGIYTLDSTCNGYPSYKHSKPAYLYFLPNTYSEPRWVVSTVLCDANPTIYFKTSELSTTTFNSNAFIADTETVIDMEIYRSEITGGCEDCPPATPLSPAGSTSVDVCYNGCDPGQAFDTNSVCQDCAAGKYQPSSGYTGDCLDCPANSDTFGVTAATAFTACKCDLGYTGADGGPCTACSTGQYKAVVGSAACLSCITNDPNSVAELDSASTFCECAAGYVLLSNVCTACIKGTYKEMQGNDTDSITANCVLVDGCCACGHNKTTLSSATVTADPNGGGCICQTGYGFGNDACLACDLGTYKDAENVQECTNCDVGGTTELIKQTSEEACISDLGYYTLDATASATLGVDFAECPQDTYASETNLLECYDCPIGSTTQALTTRTSVNDCICTETGYVAGGAHCTCAAGYYRAASGNCELCEENTYCIGAREAISGTCSANSVSDIGSTQLQDCKCNIGYSGPDGGPCTACEDHFYKANIGSEACTSCPVNSQSPTGSTSLSNCVCNAGFSGPDGGACSQCEVGTYKNLIGSSACLSCDAAETSPAASTSESACICIAGYYLVSDTCTACEIGTYQENLGATACETCPSGSSTANDASASIDLCLCMPGYYANFVDGNLAGCEQCADASYKTTLANTDCNSCPANAQSPPESDSITDCTCNAGYTGANGSPCTACEESTFKSTAGPQACDTCDANAYSPTGSTLQTACQCNAGYTGADGDVCVECEAGKYKTTIGASVCTPCPLNSYSNAASTLLQQCLCNAGYTGANGAQCSVCAVGTYKSLSGESECINCADNEISPQASTDISACECNVGHAYNVDTNSCEECIAGKFKDTIGDIDCSLCPLHSSSIAGATLITQCICNAGYEGVHGDTCVLCPAGKYENDAHVCVNCPDNSDSQSGASSVFDCKCDAGFTGPNGGPCTACATGTYKINAGSAICTSCNLHATTLQDASTLATDCLCETAYTLIDSSCTMCSENTFKTEISNAACTNCQEFAVSPAGSTQPSDCTCIDQYFDAGDGSCDRACGLGFEANLGETKCVGCQESYYKDFTGIDSCVACPENAFSRTRNSTSIYFCSCHVGYYWSENSCIICPAGKFTNIENVTACFDCVQAANADPATNIICPSLNQVPAGFEINSAQNGIQICPNNTFNDGSLLTCTSCPSPSTFTNQAGLTSILQCNCNPGYFRNAENVCVACSLNTFKTQSGDDACTVCPANANTLQTASTSLSDCLCNPNYQLAPAGTLATPVCEACQAPAVKHTTSNVDSCVTCPEHATLLVGSEHDPLHCVCDPGYAFQNQQTCQACVNGKFKATFSDTTCLSCGANTETEPSAAATSKTQCLCKITYEASINGPPSVAGGSCVRSCAPGKSGSAGVCSDCPRGRFKSSYGSACESCTFPRTASAKATKSKEKCTCPKRSFGIKATDLVTVSSIGSFIEDTAEMHVAIYDATSQTYSMTYVSKKYWKIQLGGVYQTVLLTVDNKKVFSCESNQFAVASSFCSNLNIDLQKIRGSLQLFAQRFNSEENILPNNVELYVFTEREVTFENVQPWVTTSVQNKAKSWAADGNLQIGGAVFRNKRVFNTENCAPCPRALVCREPA